MKNDLEDLRGILFDTMRDLRKSGEDAMDLDRAQTIATVAQVAVDAAKTEVSFMKTTGQLSGSTFFAAGKGLPAPEAPKQIEKK